MPCNGVTITSAQVNFDLKEFFDNKENRDQFVKFLREQDVPVLSHWYRRQNGWSIAIRTPWSGLAFEGNEIKISDMNQGADAKRYEADFQRAYGLAQYYIGQQIQATLIKAFGELSLEPRDVKVGKDGSIEVRINLSSATPKAMMVYKETARVKIGLDGSMNLVTENGAYDVGKRKLDLFMNVLNGRNGFGVTPSGEYESHRHGDQQERQRLQW